LVTSLRSSSTTSRMRRRDAGDPLAGLRVGGAVVVGAHERVDEDPCHRHVGRVDGGEVVDQRVPEIGVGAVRPVGQLAQLRVALAPRQSDRVRARRAGTRRLLLLGGGLGLGLQFVVGSLDRGLDELAVERPVDDDRAPAFELDQHARSRALGRRRRR
jgi:hypothetical protein